MIPHPPSPHAGRLPALVTGTPAAGVRPPKIRRANAAALACVVAWLVAGCGIVPSPTPAAPASLSPTGGPSGPPVSPSLASSAVQSVPGLTPSASASVSRALGLAISSGGILRVVGADGHLAGVAAPARPLRQLGTTRDGLLAVLDDGSVARWRSGGTTWSPVAGITGAAAAAVDPSGEAIAVLAADRLGTGRPLALAVRMSPSGPLRTLDGPGLQANGAPSWLSDGRIVVRAVGSAGANVLAFADPPTSRVTTRPFDGVDVTVSADGGTAAILLPDGVRVAPASALADGGPGAGAEVEAVGRPDATSPGAIALDRTGARIAIAWVDEGGATVAITVAAASTGWRETDAIDPPDADILLAWSS